MPRGEFDRSQRRARTRTQLLEAAARVYARHGFEGATLDEVAEEAGFTKGAVYDHFGSKERLLFALLEEHVSNQIAEQVALFDPSLDTSQRPRAGADRWMQELEEDPDAFRLFVEAWLHAQRDAELGTLVLGGMEQWRAALQGFGATRTEELGFDVPEALLEQIANLMLGLGLGLGMIKLADPASIPSGLLAASFVVLLRAIESSPEARQLLLEAASVSR